MIRIYNIFYNIIYRKNFIYNIFFVRKINVSIVVLFYFFCQKRKHLTLFGHVDSEIFLEIIIKRFG